MDDINKFKKPNIAIASNSDIDGSFAKIVRQTSESMQIMTQITNKAINNINHTINNSALLTMIEQANDIANKLAPKINKLSIYSQSISTKFSQTFTKEHQETIVRLMKSIAEFDSTHHDGGYTMHYTNTFITEEKTYSGSYTYEKETYNNDPQLLVTIQELEKENNFLRNRIDTNTEPIIFRTETKELIIDGINVAFSGSRVQSTLLDILFLDTSIKSWSLGDYVDALDDHNDKYNKADHKKWRDKARNTVYQINEKFKKAGIYRKIITYRNGIIYLHF